MEIDFENQYLADAYFGRQLNGKPKYQKEVILKFIKVVNILRALPRIETIFQFNSLGYEKLSGNKMGLSSVRITKKYRLEFGEESNMEGAVFKIIITDLSNHYK